MITLSTWLRSKFGIRFIIKLEPKLGIKLAVKFVFRLEGVCVMNNIMADNEMEKQEYSSSDILTQMFYLLMRDAVSFGEMESIVAEVERGFAESVDTIVYSNGHLAKYAKELADRIRDEDKIRGAKIEEEGE